MDTLKMKFNYPWADAGDRCAQEAVARPEYDPVSLFRWGNMLAMSVLGMLQTAEEEFGEAGQIAMTRAPEEVGGTWGGR